MNNSLEQETGEEFETKYNLIFENPVNSNNFEEKPVNQILDSNINESTSKESFSSEEPEEECTALVTVKERRLMAAQNMFKKSIRISLKSFLISLSLSFLNLFI